MSNPIFEISPQGLGFASGVISQKAGGLSGLASINAVSTSTTVIMRLDIEDAIFVHALQNVSFGNAEEQRDFLATQTLTGFANSVYWASMNVLFDDGTRY